MTQEIHKFISTRKKAAFSDHGVWLDRWQRLSEMFYQSDAHFTQNASTPRPDVVKKTITKFPSKVFSDHYVTLMSILFQGQWLKMVIKMNDDTDKDDEVLSYEEYVTKKLLSAYSYGQYKHRKALTMAFASFVLYGNYCIMRRELKDRTPFWECVHLSQVAWETNSLMQINTVFRRLKMPAYEVVDTFENAPQEVKDVARKNPDKKIQVCHCQYPVMKMPHLFMKMDRDSYASIWFTDDHILEVKEVRYPIYTCGRMHSDEKSMYGVNPVSDDAFDESVQLQKANKLTTTAIEKMVDPPLLTNTDVISSRVRFRAGAVIPINNEDASTQYHDHRRPAAEPLNITGDPNAGMAFAEEKKQLIRQIFLMNVLDLPTHEERGQITAFEINLRHRESNAKTHSIVSYADSEFTMPILDADFRFLWHLGFFDSHPAPTAIEGDEVPYDFVLKSPAKELADREKLQHFATAIEAAGVDPALLDNIDRDGAYREGVLGQGLNPNLLKDPDEVKTLRESRLQAAQAREAAQNAQAEQVVNTETTERQARALETARRANQ